MKKFECVILGAGESGVGSAILAKKQGLTVFVSDKNLIAPAFRDELVANNIWFEQGAHSEEIMLNADFVIKSPGIPSRAHIIQQILKANIPVMSELDFAQQFSSAKVIAITGTNGKTTTTSMVYELLNNAGFKVELAGNIGISYARMVANKKPDYVVLEVSSFQLDDVRTFKPDIAILTNLSPDHLDRYDYEYQNYINAKFKLIQNQREGDCFVYNLDDADTLLNLHQVPQNTTCIPISYYKSIDKGACIEQGLMKVFNLQNKINFTMNIQHLALKGIHNTYNSMATAVVGSALNVRKEVIRESLANFKNVEHRLEHVASVRGVDFINDSKATNVNAAWFALESAQNPVIWIAGGVDKGNDYESLVPLIKEKVKLIICLGVDNTKLHNAFSKHVDLMLNTTSMQEAVKTAFRFASKGDTVLLSPACASFDLFLNYQDRGWAFKQSVKGL
jgi:UDP-N-acetylmuramoylalanine--D-glutamate ligase